jgi:hypothetical protein
MRIDNDSRLDFDDVLIRPKDWTMNTHNACVYRSFACGRECALFTKTVDGRRLKAQVCQ